MTDQVKITSETALMMETMVGLEPSEPRYHLLKAAVDYKASWLELAEKLNVVAETKAYKEWGHSSFKDYCTEELQLTQSAARKLVRGFQWVDQEAPELLSRAIEEQGDVAANSRGVVPDVNTVNVLVKAQKEVAEERLTREAYDELKAKALTGEPSAYQLRKDLKEAAEEPKKDPRAEQIKILRRSLKAAERIINQLEEADTEDEELHQMAEDLRERIFDLVSELMDERAYGEDGGEGDDDAPEGSETERVTVLGDPSEGASSSSTD